MTRRLCDWLMGWGALLAGTALLILLTRGWSVFFPLVRTTKCDLVAVSSGGLRVKRIEVRSGKRVSGGLAYNKKTSDICDHYAVIISDEPVLYVPPIETGDDPRPPKPPPRRFGQVG